MTAAGYNWSIAAAGLLAPGLTYKMLMPISAPQNLAMTWMFMALVATFGLGYFWASRDFEANRSVVKLGVAGKCAVFFLAPILYFQGQIEFLFLLAAIGDAVFAGLFAWALSDKDRQGLFELS